MPFFIEKHKYLKIKVIKSRIPNRQSQILVSRIANGTDKTIVFSLHFFVLIQRNEAKKNQGKPDRSARFA
jgi:hypothetical protein